MDPSQLLDAKVYSTLLNSSGKQNKNKNKRRSLSFSLSLRISRSSMSWAHHPLYPLSRSLSPHFPLTVVVSPSSVRSSLSPHFRITVVVSSSLVRSPHKCGRVDVASAHGLSGIWLQRTPEPAATLSHRTLSSSSFLSPCCRLWEPRGKYARKIRHIFRTWLEKFAPVYSQQIHTRFPWSSSGTFAAVDICRLAVLSYLQTFYTLQSWREENTGPFFLTQGIHNLFILSSNPQKTEGNTFSQQNPFFLNKGKASFSSSLLIMRKTEDKKHRICKPAFGKQILLIE